MDLAIDVRSLMEGRHSGVAEYTQEIIAGFLRIAPTKHTYHVFYNSWRPVTLPDFGGKVIEHRLSFPNKLLTTSQFLLQRPYWSQLVSADCFFVPNIGLLPLPVGTPYVVTAHDLSFERFPYVYSWRRRLWHTMIRPRRLMQRASRVVAVSHSTAHDVETLYGVGLESIAVVHSGVRTQPVSADDRVRVRQRYALPEKFVLFLATLEPRKNIATLIRSFSAIAEQVPHDLVIAGNRGWLLRDFKEALEGSAVRERIHLVGSVEDTDKTALYALADLFVYPSLYEGFGFPPLEALAAGTPVITSHNSSLPEVVGEWATLIDPYSPAELALVLKELLQAPPPVSLDIQRTVQERFRWDVTAEKTLRVIEGVV